MKLQKLSIKPRETTRTEAPKEHSTVEQRREMENTDLNREQPIRGKQTFKIKQEKHK